jgi:hypothetical protein
MDVLPHAIELVGAGRADEEVDLSRESQFGGEWLDGRAGE